MLLSAYYHLKPLIPRRAQLALRRYIMRRRRAKCGAVWPIDPKAKYAPPGWPGWPENKRFALVLTHDVESQRGCDRCLDLADMEQKLGFRSSFNFVAEDYVIPPLLRQELTDRGFEVGIHGITHDGHLYRSRTHFMRQAARINAYLREWQAVGFRSPAMHRNFEWIGDLDIQYDSSSFDTDPFEPHPDGVGVLFPFLVGAPNSARKYVELPYTLPQDFTLFVVFQERNIDTWRKKLDWIAEHGGMALLITHPDYMIFKDSTRAVDEYPSSLYRDYLQYVDEKYRGQFWPALPREIADYLNSILDRGQTSLHR